MPTKSGKAFVGWTKNIVKNNIQQFGHSGSSTTIDKTTNKFTFSIFFTSSATGELWRSFYIDVSGLAGKTLTISGKLAGLSENNASFYYLVVGQGHEGTYPTFFPDSSDSKQVCDRASYSDGLYFSHTLTIIDNPSIIGLCIWGNVTSAGGKVELTVENLQVEVGASASDFESSAQPLYPTTQKTCYKDETYVAMWDTNILDATNSFHQAGWSGDYTIINVGTNKYEYIFAVYGETYNPDDGYAWVSFWLDMSSYVGKLVTISGSLEELKESGADFSSLTVGQGNTGKYPTSIVNSPDSKRVCFKPSYKYGLKFTHTVKIIENPSLIGLDIWIANTQNSNAIVSLRITDLQIGVYG